MDSDVQLISDGLALIEEPAAVERFLSDEWS